MSVSCDPYNKLCLHDKHYNTIIIIIIIIQKIINIFKLIRINILTRHLKSNLFMLQT